MVEKQEINSTIKNKINNIDDFFRNTYLSFENLSAKNRSLVGWFCSYTPEELITAGEFIPCRIFGRKKMSRSESYFPINFCPYIKSGLESFLDPGSIAGFKGLIFTNSCDGMRRFYDIAHSYLKDTPSFFLDVPHLNGSDSVEFFSNNIKDMKIFLEKIRGKKITASEIEKAIITINRKRELIRELNLFFKKYPGILNINTYFEIMELSLTSAPSIFIDDLKKYLIFIKEITDSNKADLLIENKNSVPIMIIGNFIAEKKLWEMLSTMNLNIAFDDLCTSMRYFEKQIELDSSIDPIIQIARRYLNKPACMRMTELSLKLSEIENNIIKNDIKGVLFISLKFCDTMLYFFPLLKKKMNEMGIPILYLEVEYNNFSEGQARTRLEAFLETL
jgi:benzoyl-CoA reductase/2-hydroxyglutaryl-CoA dehydratase subunit BcrC/BadD/HgdB